MTNHKMSALLNSLDLDVILISRPGYTTPICSENHFHLMFSALEKNQGHTLIYNPWIVRIIT